MRHKLNDEPLPPPRMDICAVSTRITGTFSPGIVSSLLDVSSLCGENEVRLCEHLCRVVSNYKVYARGLWSGCAPLTMNYVPVPSRQVSAGELASEVNPGEC